MKVRTLWLSTGKCIYIISVLGLRYSNKKIGYPTISDSVHSSLVSFLNKF